MHTTNFLLIPLSVLLPLTTASPLPSSNTPSENTANSIDVTARTTPEGGCFYNAGVMAPGEDPYCRTKRSASIDDKRTPTATWNENSIPQSANTTGNATIHEYQIALENWASSLLSSQRHLSHPQTTSTSTPPAPTDPTDQPAITMSAYTDPLPPFPSSFAPDPTETIDPLDQPFHTLAPIVTGSKRDFTFSSSSFGLTPRATGYPAYWVDENPPQPNDTPPAKPPQGNEPECWTHDDENGSDVPSDCADEGEGIPNRWLPPQSITSRDLAVGKLEKDKAEGLVGRGTLNQDLAVAKPDPDMEADFLRKEQDRAHG